MLGSTKVAVVGVGMTKFGSDLGKSNRELFCEAAMDAIDESNITAKDIQALFLGNVLGALWEGQTNIAGFCAADIGAQGIPATRYEGACAASSMAIREAVMWVASGVYDIVLAGGMEVATQMGTPFATRCMAMGMDSDYEFGTGFTFPGVFGMLAHLYAYTYGISLEKLKEQMRFVTIKNHENGSLNPKGHFPATIKDIMNRQIIKAKQKGQPVPAWSNEMEFLKDPSANPYVTDPLQLYDCCPFSEGGAGVVLASAERAKSLTNKPVYIAGTGQASAGNLSSQRRLPRIIARELSAKEAYTMAGLEPEDIDICELHDCFTIAEIIATEGLGFFDFGKGAEAVERGETNRNGKIAINPSGGLKSKGHPIGATGAAQVYEVTKQLRGECGERQVEGAKIGMTDTLGGDGGTVCNIILKRGW